MENKSHELEVAIEAALEVGKILEKYFETEILRETKEDDSVVTHADKEAEEIIKKAISSAFPEHSIMGEETGMTQNGHEYTWYVDPIDGTRNFANGIPFFAVSIALVKDNEIILGVIYNPATDSLFYAEKGKGAYWNKNKMQVSQDKAARSIVTVTSGRKPEDLKIRRSLMHDLPNNTVASVRDFGCSALDLAFVARGNLEADIQLGLKTYDFAAGMLMVMEAGGMITDTEGNPWKFPGNYYIASNGVFHDMLVDEIKKLKSQTN